MLLFVSTKGERLANWTTVVSKVFLPAPLSFPPILSAQSRETAVSSGGRRGPVPHWSGGRCEGGEISTDLSLHTFQLKRPISVCLILGSLAPQLLCATKFTILLSSVKMNI